MLFLVYLDLFARLTILFIIHVLIITLIWYGVFCCIIKKTKFYKDWTRENQTKTKPDSKSFKNKYISFSNKSIFESKYVGKIKQ